MKKEPPNPKSEFYVAIAGPIVSIVIAIVMHFLTAAGLKLHWPLAVTGVTSYLALINLVIVVFNMIPAFPLDGGRILRALLWGWKDNLEWATRISTTLGSGFGYGLVILGIYSFLTGQLFSGLWWMILGLFLHKAASLSRTQYYIKQQLEGEKVDKFMTKDPIFVSPAITIKEFIDQYIYQSHHHLYPVVDNGILQGYISLKEVKSLLPEEWNTTPVGKVMIPLSQFQTISPETSVMEALNLFQEEGLTTLLVSQKDRLVGILTAQDIFKAISIKLELSKP